MRLTGRRESSNVEDRRGGSSGMRMTTGKKGGCAGIIMLIIGALIWWKTGDSTMFVNNLGVGQGTTTEQTTTNTGTNKAQDELAVFASRILASTEDIWTSIFQQNGMTYQKPKMVIFSDAVNTGCGSASSSTGPFYCSADQKLYLDLSFFTTMKRQLGAEGDLAYAYVIAHEVGHHVEYLTGLLSKLHQQMDRARSDAEANAISVRIELLADFYAGVWGHYENKTFKSFEDGDLEEAINCAHQIGDDYLQKSAGYRTINPESFTHGTSAQRMKWLKLGLQTGDLSRANQILTCSESEL
ncbi:MAG: neutral zinc metallopeptidase [Bacteroidales bacterium]|nr:neutral zinc metallopeptidase [Bacteroidales bacterium]MBR2887331.1 neutral zinc metallopeptidase [Bacteroidales bacterium]